MFYRRQETYDTFPVGMSLRRFALCDSIWKPWSIKGKPKPLCDLITENNNINKKIINKSKCKDFCIIAEKIFLVLSKSHLLYYFYILFKILVELIKRCKSLIISCVI